VAVTKVVVVVVVRAVRDLAEAAMATEVVVMVRNVAFSAQPDIRHDRAPMLLGC